MKMVKDSKPTSWGTLKTEAIDFSKEFYWIEDEPMWSELEKLKEYGAFERWLQIDTRKNPDDLKRAILILKEKIQGGSCRMRMILICCLLGLSLTRCCFSQEEIIEEENFWSDRYLLILKSTKDFLEAHSFAIKASKELKKDYISEYKLFMPERGIFFSDTLPDDMYRGEYYPRRYEEDQISLENSSGYKDFEPDYIIVVAGIFSSKEDAEKALAKARLVYPDAYVKKTNIWMGCIH